MADESHVIEEIEPSECDALLQSCHFGRLGVVVDGGPVIFPVNYVYANSRVTIRTDPGSKLSAADLGKVAFEIDAVDDEARVGWSVLVQGTGYDITDAIDEVSEDMRHFPVDTWGPGEKVAWIRIEPRSVTGRRIRPA